MIVNVNDPDSHKWLVVDLTNRTFINDVQYANDETGEITRTARHNSGRIKYTLKNGHTSEKMISEIRQIKLIRMENGRSKLTMSLRDTK